MSAVTSDPFDALLVKTADVLVRNLGPGDVRGLSDPTFQTVDTAVPVAVTTSRKKVLAGKEFLAKEKEAIAYREVFMRPWFDPNTAEPLSHNHWLKVDGQMYDIFEVDPIYDGRDGSTHHLEVWCRLVLI